MALSFYVRFGESASACLPILPSGYFGAWNQSNTSASGSNALRLDTSSGSSELTEAFTSNISGLVAVGVAQACSAPLASGSYSSGSWTVAFAATSVQSPNLYTWVGYAGIYLAASDGTLKTTIADLQAINASTFANGTTSPETSCYSASVSGSAFTPANGDYLVLELGIQAHRVGSTAAGAVHTVYADGTTAITSDGATVSDAQSVVTAPASISLLSCSSSSSSSSFSSSSGCGNLATFANGAANLVQANNQYLSVPTGSAFNATGDFGGSLWFYLNSDINGFTQARCLNQTGSA